MKRTQFIAVLFIIISIYCVFFLAIAVALNYNIFCHLRGKNTSHLFLLQREAASILDRTSGPCFETIEAQFLQGLYLRRHSMNAIFKNYIYGNDVAITNPPLKPIDPLSVKMKIKKPILIAGISIIFSGIVILGVLALSNRPEIAGDRSSSISMGTVLFLLAVGISGALSVRRKKKNDRRSASTLEPKAASDDRNQAFVRLNKQYLNLQYKITQKKYSGENPPNHIMKEIYDLERKVRLISRALE